MNNIEEKNLFESHAENPANEFMNYDLDILTKKLEEAILAKKGIESFYVHNEDIVGAQGEENVEDLEMKNFMKHNRDERKILEAIKAKIASIDERDRSAFHKNVQEIIKLIEGKKSIEELEDAILGEEAA